MSAYEEACQRAGVVDFAELLLRAFEIWRDNPALLQHYRTRFRHVLVDEFQDTNAIQYRWLTLLAGPTATAVRGRRRRPIDLPLARRAVENLHQFRRDFPQATLYKLEQNYRSTGTILDAANALIRTIPAGSARRSGPAARMANRQALRRLQRARRGGLRGESHPRLGRRGGCASEVAVLYRSNAQSRVFEEAFLNARMPYRVYGGLRFFERAEIKDALAYLRLVSSRADDTSFERVVNLPTRGIGAKTLDAIREIARENGTSLWERRGDLRRAGLAQRAAQALQASSRCRKAGRGNPRSASFTTRWITWCSRAASSSITRRRRASAARPGSRTSRSS